MNNYNMKFTSEEAEKIYFTSDTHFGHENIIKFSNRPYSSVEEMNIDLISKWNEVVPEDGVVFHLGDFAFGRAHNWINPLNELNGEIHLIIGNHDNKNLKQGFAAKFKSISPQLRLNIGGQIIYLNHYPFLCYGGSYMKTIQLFGHVHTTKNGCTGLDKNRLFNLFPLQYDVGVDNNDYKPISYNEVLTIINKQIDGVGNKF